MEIILNLIIKFFLITILGLVLKKKEIITNQVEQGLSQLLVKVILPINLLVSSQNTYSQKALRNMLITALVAGIYYMVSILISNGISRVLPIKNIEKKVFIATTVFGNVGFIGFPIASELYGAEGVLYAIIFNIFFQLGFFTYGVSILTGEKSNFLKVLAKNPVTICSFLSIALFLLQIKIQTGVLEAMTSVGSMTAAFSLILIGCNLSNVKMKEILTDKYSYLVSLCRMILYPGMMFLALSFLKFPTVVAGICALLTALPTGSLNVIYAQGDELAVKFASKAVIQTMLFMIVVLPGILFLIKLYL